MVTFDLEQDVTSGGRYLVNDAGQEVSYQILSGGARGVFALTTDLPANVTWTFSLQSGPPSPRRRDAGRRPSGLLPDH